MTGSPTNSGAPPISWQKRSLDSLAQQPFVLEPPGTTAYEWSVATCRHAGFEPDVRYVSTDLQIHLTLVEHGLAAALVPDLSGAAARSGVIVRQLPSCRLVFAAVRRGAVDHPTVQAFVRGLEAAHGELTRQTS